MNRRHLLLTFATLSLHLSPKGLAEVSPGEILISEMNCVACHEAAAPVANRLASRQSPVLGATGVRLTPQWLRAFLENPHATQRGTLMPDVLHTLPPVEKAAAADALTHFLISLQPPAAPGVLTADPTQREIGKRLYHEVGCVMCHAPDELPAGAPKDAPAQEEFARLQQVSVPLGDLGRKFTHSELAAFLRDPLKTRPSGRMPAMHLPESDAHAVAMWLLRSQMSGTTPAQMVPLGGEPFTLDPAKAASGRELFAEMNCASCHSGTDVAGRKARALADLRARQPSGCISPVAKPGVPRFDLTDRQRIVIQAALGSQEVLNVPLEPTQVIRRTLTVLNCYACHSRDRRGGADGLRRIFLTSIGGAEIGDEARIPPSLSGIGAKLQPDWMQKVLIEGASVRPYMATRMPVFGEANVGHLAPLFESVDARADAFAEPQIPHGEAAETGRALIGIAGLSCIACHTFAEHASLGMPALDLTTMPSRLKWDWLRRYLLDPQALRPGTRMPTFWPDGTATSNVAGGDTERQIFAIWSYLARKDFHRLPEGLPPQKR